MPYYVYGIEARGPARKLDALGVFEDYAGASRQCRRLRATARGAGVLIKMIVADNALRAEELLSEVREAGPLVDEDY